MWCIRCKYGSEVCEMDVCPQCGNDSFSHKCPFPSTPKGMGSGKPNGKTAKKRKVT